IVQMIDEVTASEVAWTDYAFSEGPEFTGVTSQMMKDWVHFSATDVARLFNVQDQVSLPLITENPLKYMESWLNMSKVHASNQEEDTAQFKVGVMKRDDENEVFDVDLSTRFLNPRPSPIPPTRQLQRIRHGHHRLFEAQLPAMRTHQARHGHPGHRV